MEMGDLVRWIRLLESERDGTPEVDAEVDAALTELLENPNEFAARLLPVRKRIEQSTETTMTPEDALTAMAAVESQRSSIGDGKADTLTMVLLSNPAEFWDAYFTTPPMPGAVALFVQLGSDASLADLRAALEVDARS